MLWWLVFDGIVTLTSGHIQLWIQCDWLISSWCMGWEGLVGTFRQQPPLIWVLFKSVTAQVSLIIQHFFKLYYYLVSMERAAFNRCWVLATSIKSERVGSSFTLLCLAEVTCFTIDFRPHRWKQYSSRISISNDLVVLLFSLYFLLCCQVIFQDSIMVYRWWHKLLTYYVLSQA